SAGQPFGGGDQLQLSQERVRNRLLEIRSYFSSFGTKSVPWKIERNQKTRVAVDHSCSSRCRSFKKSSTKFVDGPLSICGAPKRFLKSGLGFSRSSRASTACSTYWLILVPALRAACSIRRLVSVFILKVTVFLMSINRTRSSFATKTNLWQREGYLKKYFRVYLNARKKRTGPRMGF